MSGVEVMSDMQVEEQRSTSLEGIGDGSRMTEIADRLGVKLLVVRREVRTMQYQRSPELKVAREKAYSNLMAERGAASSKSGERFMEMTGLTFQEKTFQNMVDFYKPELRRILESENQYAAILRLPKSVLRTLRGNEIILRVRGGFEIASGARRYLV